MENKIANIISLLFHPLLGPTYGLAFLLYSDSYFSYIPIDAKLILLLISFAGTFILPITFMPFFLYKTIIKNLTLTERKERIIPLIITVVAFYFTYFVIKQLPVPLYLTKFFFASTILVILSLVITFWWKISNHMIGIGGLTGFILITGFSYTLDTHLFFSIAIIISGLVAFARLQLKAHNNLQLYSGYFLGFLTMFLFMILY